VILFVIEKANIPSSCQPFGYIGRLIFLPDEPLLTVGNLLNLFNMWNFLEQMLSK
jgi:hypothetical protein